MLESQSDESLTHRTQPVNNTSRSGTPPPTGTRRSRKFWFTDGTIILQAETTRFRVHAGILAANSIFFEDLWRLPQPRDQALVDGSPLVHMQSDTAQDWENMLTMIYYHMRLRSQRLQASFLASLLRLGKKYQFDIIRDYALDHLKQRFPARKALLSDGPGIDARDIRDLFEVANFARELGVETILPIVYYGILVTITLTEILDGCPGRDGTITRLSPDVQRLLVLKETAIRVATMDITWGWLLPSAPWILHRCQNFSRCAERRQWLKTVTSTTTILRGLSQALIRSSQTLEHRKLTYSFCESCQQQNIQQYRDAQLSFYNVPPLLFDMA